MVAVGIIGSTFIGIFAQISLSTGYEPGTLSMFQAMTFYESFGLEVAYKIIKRKLGCRVYIFSNLSQVWHDQETIQYYDQIFMLIIGRTTKMYNLFEKLEEVNFQTGFELIAEKIVDGNLPYLNWASRFVPPYDTANETTVAENIFLPDTNEAFTFRENFINKKYGTLPPNHTIFAGLDLESNSNNSLQRILHMDIKPYQDLLERIRKGERFPPDATFPGLEMEQDDEFRALSELQEEPIRESLKLIKEQEQKAGDARRNFGMRQRGYYKRNTPDMVNQDMQGYYERNPRFYKQNQLNLPDRDMARYYEQKARELYGGDIPIYGEQNQPILSEYDYQHNYLPHDHQKEQMLYGGDVQMYGPWNLPSISKHDYPLHVRQNVKPVNIEQNSARNWKRREVEQNMVRNGQRSYRPKMEQTSKRRSFMDVIKSFIYSDSVNKARDTRNRKGPKVRQRMYQAQRKTEVYEPYQIMQDKDEIDSLVGRREHNFMNHYIYVQHVNHPNFENGQGFRNERKPAKAKKSRFRKNDKQAPKAGKTIRAKARYINGMENGYIQPEMTHRENSQRKMKYYQSQAANIYHRNKPNINYVQHNPIGFYKVDPHISNCHAPRAIHPQIENNFAHFHQIDEADFFNQQNPPQHNTHKDYQLDKTRLCGQQFVEPGHNIRVANMYENVAFHDNQQHHLHKVQHLIGPQPKQNDIGHFHLHNDVIQRLPAVHVDQQNMHGQGVRLPCNPNNLPVLSQVADRQAFHFIRNDPLISVPGIPNVKAKLEKLKAQNFVKFRQSRKVKNAPKVRQQRAGKWKALWARKSKMTTSLHQYNVDIEGNTPVHFIDVLQYHYEPRQKVGLL